jgi:glutathione peroxidase
MSTIYSINVTTIDGQTQALSVYRDKLLLIVNVASRCGFTPQYAGLEALWQKYRASGLVILGFPCNQFGAQEPDDENAIAQFCSLTYQVSFPLFAKICVNGNDTHPLYAYLKSAAPGLLGSEMIKWNFTKFLVDRQGQVLNRYAPATSPAELEADIVRALGNLNT